MLPPHSHYLIVDPARHLIFVGTGNNYTAPDNVSADPTTVDLTDYTDAVLALNMASGKLCGRTRLWAWRLIPGNGPEGGFTA